MPQRRLSREDWLALRKPRGEGNLMVLADDRELWEQQPHEGARSYRRFLVYCGLGAAERSIEKAWLKITDDGTKVTYPSFQQYANHCRWTTRAKAWDKHMDAVKQKALEEAFAKEGAELGRVQAQAGRFLMDKGLERLTMIPVADLTQRQALQMIVEGVKIERLARGEATGRIDMRVVQVIVERVAQRLGRPVVDVMAEVEELVQGISG